MTDLTCGLAVKVLTTRLEILRTLRRCTRDRLERRPTSAGRLPLQRDLSEPEVSLERIGLVRPIHHPTRTPDAGRRVLGRLVIREDLLDALAVRPRSPPEPISGAAHRLHDVAPELLAKVTDVDLDDVGTRVAVVSPDLIEELGL